MQTSQEKNKCSICIDFIEKKSYETPCGHNYHLKCLLKWLEKSSCCPNCKKDIPEDKEKLINYDGNIKLFSNWNEETNFISFQNMSGDEFEEFINVFYINFMNRNNSVIEESDSDEEVEENKITDETEDEFKNKKIRLK